MNCMKLCTELRQKVTWISKIFIKLCILMTIFLRFGFFNFFLLFYVMLTQFYKTSRTQPANNYYDGIPSAFYILLSKQSLFVHTSCRLVYKRTKLPSERLHEVIEKKWRLRWKCRLLLKCQSLSPVEKPGNKRECHPLT